MATVSKYYSVSTKIYPFNVGSEKEVGCYASKDLAKRVASMIMQTFGQKVYSGIDIGIQKHRGEMVRCIDYLRLADMPHGEITIIHEELSPDELKRLLNFLPLLFKSRLIEQKDSSSVIDEPKYIYNNRYYSITLNFPPFDKSHRLYVGYYQNQHTANAVSDYIKQTHYQKKIGSGFDMAIETVAGETIVCESGKQYVKVGEKFHEIQASCDGYDFLKVSKAVNKAIEKWSGNELKEWKK